jgi:hypothetical protein
MTESGDQAGVSFGNNNGQDEDNSWIYTDNKENGSGALDEPSKKVKIFCSSQADYSNYIPIQ